MNLQFITTNQLKLERAKLVLETFNISLTQNPLDFDELQSYDGEAIARHKAEQAYAAVGKPLVVTDDSWAIPALNDFPGPYMKAMNHYLSKDDWARLIAPLTDRRIFWHEHLVYQDASGQYYTMYSIERTLLKEPRGEHRFSHIALIDYGDGRSIAEALTAGKTSGTETNHTAWHDLAEWLTTKNDVQHVR